MDGLNDRKSSRCLVLHRLSEEGHHRILLTFKQPEFDALLPGQIVPVRVDRGI
jgi:hypothetical protein